MNSTSSTLNLLNVRAIANFQIFSLFFALHRLHSNCEIILECFDGSSFSVFFVDGNPVHLIEHNKSQSFGRYLFDQGVIAKTKISLFDKVGEQGDFSDLDFELFTRLQKIEVLFRLFDLSFRSVRVEEAYKFMELEKISQVPYLVWSYCRNRGHQPRFLNWFFEIIKYRSSVPNSSFFRYALFDFFWNSEVKQVLIERSELKVENAQTDIIPLFLFYIFHGIEIDGVENTTAQIIAHLQQEQVGDDGISLKTYEKKMMLYRECKALFEERLYDELIGRVAKDPSLLENNRISMSFAWALCNVQFNNKRGFRLLKETLLNDITNPLIHFYVGKYFESLRKFNYSVYFYRQALRLNPVFGDANDALLALQSNPERLLVERLDGKFRPAVFILFLLIIIGLVGYRYFPLERLDILVEGKPDWVNVITRAEDSIYVYLNKGYNKQHEKLLIEYLKAKRNDENYAVLFDQDLAIVDIVRITRSSERVQ